jgi:hypothetical protein
MVVRLRDQATECDYMATVCDFTSRARSNLAMAEENIRYYSYIIENGGMRPNGTMINWPIETAVRKVNQYTAEKEAALRAIAAGEIKQAECIRANQAAVTSVQGTYTRARQEQEAIIRGLDTWTPFMQPGESSLTLDSASNAARAILSEQREAYDQLQDTTKGGVSFYQAQAGSVAPGSAGSMSGLLLLGLAVVALSALR